MNQYVWQKASEEEKLVRHGILEMQDKNGVLLWRLIQMIEWYVMLVLVIAFFVAMFIWGDRE